MLGRPPLVTLQFNKRKKRKVVEKNKYMSTPAKVFVGSLPRCKPDELRRLFSNYGSVVECDVMNRCAFVHLENTDMADAAIAALNGTVFKGQAIVVEAGRPKYGAGPNSRGPPASGDNPGRRPSEGQSGSSEKRPPNSGNNFKRNFREDAGGRYSNEAGGPRGSSTTGNKFGPVRNESNYRQQRSAPYSKEPPQSNESSNQGQGFRNKFAGGNDGNGGRFGNNRFQQRDNNGSQAGRRNFKNSPTSGYAGGGSSNDFHGGSSGGGGVGSLGHRGGGGGAGSNHVRQDRRGFALPVEHQQQQMGFGRFGNGPMNSGNRGANGGGRGFFNGGGGFNARRGSSHESNSHQGGGGQSKRGGKNHNQNGMNAYHSEFPPLGSGGGAPGQRNRFSGPRPGPNMGGNRRF